MDTMNAAVLKGIGKWEYQKVPIPSCGDDGVLVQTARSGVCSTDVVRSMRTGFYHYPIIPGHEFSGTVVEKGKNVSNVEIDDKVTVYPLIPCRTCRNCMMGRFNLCDNYNYLGSRSNGGYAEFVLCPGESMVPMPEGVTFEEACMAEPLSVTLHANKLAGQGDIVAVMGLGPIGLFTAQWAKLLGAKKVIGVDRNDHRFKLAKSLGIIDHFIDTRDAEVSSEIKTFTDGVGCDIVFECSGSDELQMHGILSTAKSGKVIILGNPNKNFVLTPEMYSRLLRHEISITGSWNSLTTEKEWEDSLKAIQQRKIKPVDLISHGFHLSEARQVIEDMHFKRFEFLKVSFYF